MNVDHTRYSPFVFRVRSIDHDTRKNFLWVSVVKLLILCPCIYLQDYLKAIRVIKLTQLYLRVLFTPCAFFLVRKSVLQLFKKIQGLCLGQGCGFGSATLIQEYFQE